MYLRAQQDSIKKDILKAAALKPKQIAKFWPVWGHDRPLNEICLDLLVFKEGFTESSAPQFLKVYDDTIAFAGLSSSDKIRSDPESEDDEEDDELETLAQPKGDERRGPPAGHPIPPLPPAPIASLAPGERVLTTGLLAKGASFRLIVSGHVGPKELERLIQKLELDKEILADPSADDDQAAH